MPITQSRSTFWTMRTTARFLGCLILGLFCCPVHARLLSKYQSPFDKQHGIISSLKGLGGANINVTCYPDSVEPLTPITVSVAYSVDIFRKTDIHVDCLNALSHQWYAGNVTTVDGREGALSLDVTLPEEAEEPLLWKVFVTPQFEPFPNMLAETGMIIHLLPRGHTQDTSTSTPTCPFIPLTYGDNSTDKSDSVNYVVLEKTDTGHLFLSSSPHDEVTVHYGLNTAPKGELTFAIMDKGTNLPLGGAEPALVSRGKGNVSRHLQWLSIAKKDAYVVVSLLPIGGTWATRLAEDRSYLL